MVFFDVYEFSNILNSFKVVYILVLQFYLKDIFGLQIYTLVTLAHMWQDVTFKSLNTNSKLWSLLQSNPIKKVEQNLENWPKTSHFHNGYRKVYNI